MFRLGKRTLAATLLSALPLVSHGALVDYDLRGWGLFVSAPLTLEADGPTVTASASGDRLYQDGFSGLGNYGIADLLLVGDGESLSFDFGSVGVRLAGATFRGLVGQPTGVRVYGDGNALGDFTFTHVSGGTLLDVEANDWVAQSFTFEGLAGANMGFSMTGLAVATIGASDLVGTVPIPNAVWLLASAIGLMGVFQRRQGARWRRRPPNARTMTMNFLRSVFLCALAAFAGTTSANVINFDFEGQALANYASPQALSQSGLTIEISQGGAVGFGFVNGGGDPDIPAVFGSRSLSSPLPNGFVISFSDAVQGVAIDFADLGGAAAMRVVSAFGGNANDLLASVMSDQAADTLSLLAPPGAGISKIMLVSQGGNPLWDNLRLTRVPEPVTASLMGLGLALLGVRRRRGVG